MIMMLRGKKVGSTQCNRMLKYNYFGMPEPIFMELDVYSMAPEPISTACFINSSHQCVCLYVHLSYRCKATAQ
jgi:hypothetical protein